MFDPEQMPMILLTYLLGKQDGQTISVSRSQFEEWLKSDVLSKGLGMHIAYDEESDTITAFFGPKPTFLDLKEDEEEPSLMN